MSSLDSAITVTNTVAVDFVYLGEYLGRCNSRDQASLLASMVGSMGRDDTARAAQAIFVSDEIVAHYSRSTRDMIATTLRTLAQRLENAE